MSIILLQATTFGVKNIEKPITINFYGKNSLKNIDLWNNNVRAIYGTNGSGKTAIVASFLLAKHLMLNNNYLSQKGNDFFDCLLNKKTHTFSFDAIFVNVSKKENKTQKEAYIYHIILKKSEKEEIERYFIAEESLFSVKSNALNEKNKLIFKVEKGNLSFESSSLSHLEDVIRNKTLNLLTASSLVSNFLFNSNLIKEATHDQQSELAKGLFTSSRFATRLFVYLDENDIHDYYFPTPEIEIKRLSAQSAEEIKSNFLNFLSQKNTPTTQVKKEDYLSYEIYIKQMTAFLKLFKPELQKIEITKKEDKDYYFCSKTLVYPDYSVDQEFESTGIKKLINIFRYLRDARSGYIVFIDEIDANISGVYLTKLIEYFLKNGKGQLCFTAHNTDPMHALVSCKKSIYFLGESGELTAWIRNGNYKPYMLYPEGMIKGIPFNITDFDFVSVFEGKR